MQFSELNLVEPLRRALAAEGYETPTPIQERAIPIVLEGRDLLGAAQTGTGKTAAFSLPLLQRLSERPAAPHIRALVLSPTRELAAQIGERIGAYGKHLGLKHVVVFGGVSQFHQVKAMKPPPAVLVATPGRLIDLCNQRLVDLSKVEILVLDEADRMLDMGFIRDVRRIVAMTPKSRQTLLFSATMPRDIAELARDILVNPARVDVAPQTKTADTVEQSIYFVARDDKRALLKHLLDNNPAIERVLVFTRTKHGASRVATQLVKAGVGANAIHGDKTQGARERALAEFKRGLSRVLVATDIAARGIDVDGVTHVVNYDLPNIPDSYVHRIGRTGRAGASGIALSFCDAEEREFLADIERLVGKRIAVVDDHPFRARAGEAPVRSADSNGGGRGQGRGQGQGQQRRGGGNGGPRNDHQRRDGGNSRNGNGGSRHPNDARPSNGGSPRYDARPANGPRPGGDARPASGGGARPASGGGARIALRPQTRVARW